MFWWGFVCLFVVFVFSFFGEAEGGEDQGDGGSAPVFFFFFFLAGGDLGVELRVLNRCWRRMLVPPSLESQVQNPTVGS